MVSLRRVKLCLLTTVFAATLLPMLAMVLNIQSSVSLRAENRALAAMPIFDLKTIATGDYFVDLERCFNDHFGFRPYAIKGRQMFDASILHRCRPDLVQGQDEFLFHRFIVEGYTPERIEKFPRDAMVGVFLRLRDKLARSGARLMIVSYPNKELICHDKLPWYWTTETDLTKLPSYQALSDLQEAGIPVLILAPAFRALKEREEVFSPVEENHCSPTAFFYSMREILAEASKASGTALEIPTDFRKRDANEGGQAEEAEETPRGPRTPGIYESYMQAFKVYADYGPPPWSEVVVEPGGWRGFYTSANGMLPATTIYTDSFVEFLSEQFGPVLFPYFKELRIDCKTFSPKSITADTRLVIVSFSDQSIESYISYFDDMLKQMP